MLAWELSSGTPRGDADDTSMSRGQGSLGLSLSGGVTPSRHLRPSSGRELTIVQLIQSGDDDHGMLPTGQRGRPTLNKDCLGERSTDTEQRLSGREVDRH